MVDSFLSFKFQLKCYLFKEAFPDRFLWRCLPHHSLSHYSIFFFIIVTVWNSLIFYIFIVSPPTLPNIKSTKAGTYSLLYLFCRVSTKSCTDCALHSHVIVYVCMYMAPCSLGSWHIVGVQSTFNKWMKIRFYSSKFPSFLWAHLFICNPGEWDWNISIEKMISSLGEILFKSSSNQQIPWYLYSKSEPVYSSLEKPPDITPRPDPGSISFSFYHQKLHLFIIAVLTTCCKILASLNS